MHEHFEEWHFLFGIVMHTRTHKMSRIDYGHKSGKYAAGLWFKPSTGNKKNWFGFDWFQHFKLGCYLGDLFWGNQSKHEQKKKYSLAKYFEKNLNFE